MTVWHLTDGKGRHSGVRRSQMPRDRHKHEMEHEQESKEARWLERRRGQVGGGTGQVGPDSGELLHIYNRQD